MTIKNKYVCEYPKHVQNAIRKALLTALHDIGYNGNELKELATDGMNSKIIDLDCLIDIKHYI